VNAKDSCPQTGKKLPKSNKASTIGFDLDFFFLFPVNLSDLAVKFLIYFVGCSPMQGA